MPAKSALQRSEASAAAMSACHRHRAATIAPHGSRRVETDRGHGAMPRRPKTAALARISMPNPMRTLTRHAYLSLRGCAAAFAVHVAAIAFVLNAGILTAAAQTCTTEDFARAVDRAGEALRNFNAENGPKVTAALKTLQKSAAGVTGSLRRKRSTSSTPHVSRSWMNEPPNC